jgi:signal transduction histidine kinase
LANWNSACSLRFAAVFSLAVVEALAPAVQRRPKELTTAGPADGIAMINGVERGDTLQSRLPLSRLSFRWQITLLGTLVCILFLGVVGAILGTLRYTKSAVLNTEKKHLLVAAQNLAAEYADKAEFSRQNNEAPPLKNPSAASSREVFALLSRVVLENVDGANGGFYSSSDDVLLGSPEGNYEAEAKTEATTINEQAAVLQTAKRAAATNRPTDQTLSIAPGVLLIAAVPIRDGHSVVGSAWTSKRVTGVPGANRFWAYLITTALACAALASVLLTLLVIRNLQGGVRKIEAGLRGLEGNLSAHVESESEPEEIQGILEAINRLGLTLRAKIEREKQIEGHLRHNERLAALGRLVAGVAHEVRNPLATIRLRVQMCRRDSDNAHVKDSCQIALQEIERLNGMVNRLLSFARPVQLRLESADLRYLVEERIGSFRDLASKNGVAMTASFPNDSVPLLVDKDRMAQVFDNVIQNAIEAMSGAGGTLSVTLTPQSKSAGNDDAVCIDFRDTGKGMPPSVSSRVFDPFFTTKPAGTGLGLSICHELVQAHGGDILVDSEEGRGTCVRITIPAAAA